MKNFLLLALLMIISTKIDAQIIEVKPLGIGKPTPFLHEYDLQVVDYENNPVEGAAVNYLVMNAKNFTIDTTVQLGKDAKINCVVSATPIQGEALTVSYMTLLNYKINKDGYYPENGLLTLSSKSNDISSPIINKTIVLFKPEDYLEKSFKNSPKSKSLKNKILSFIDVIRIEGLLSSVALEYGSIGMIQFKTKPYLTFSFTSTNIYNDIRLNRYDVGKEVFDLVIRKILSPLNDYIEDVSIFGYDIKVFTESKNLVDKNSIAKTNEYRFLIPKRTVKNYKNKDISGQKLIDESVILLDDERIDLKLQ